MAEMRLQKLLAERGIASRRDAEKLISDGRITVNDKIITEMGFKVRDYKDIILIDGKPLPEKPAYIYILIHKPVGYICAAKDEKGKPSILRLVPEIKERIYPLGRLDYDSSGLLILTNDGALTQTLLHPKFKVDKTYVAEIRGPISPGDIDKLKQGVELEDGITAPARISLKRRGKTSSQIEITIHEGKKRQIRRMCKAIGHPIIRLHRNRFGSLNLGKLKAGQWRELTAKEINNLKKEANTDGSKNRPNRPGSNLHR